MIDAAEQTICCFCGATIAQGEWALTYDGRARCRTDGCAQAEQRARDQAQPPRRVRVDRVNYLDGHRRPRTYTESTPQGGTPDAVRTR